MRQRPRPFDIVHVSSAHPWTDNRVHLRGAASAAEAGYRTALVAVATAGSGPDPDWDVPDAETGVYVRRVPRRSRGRRVLLSSAEVVAAAFSARARVVHLHDPELVWAIPLLRAAGRAVVYDAHEDLPEQVLGKEYLGRAARLMAVVAARAVVAVAASADIVVAATPAIAERFPVVRTVVVRNVPRIRPSDDVAPSTAQREPAAVYLGSISRDRGIDVLVGVAESDRLPAGWRVVSAGPVDASVDRERFDALVERNLIDHRGVLLPGAARDLLLRARIGLLPLLPTPAYAASIPTKLFEYLAAGLAVVATDVPLWRDLLQDVECVTWVPAGDAAAVVAAIQRYHDHPDLLARHGERGRVLVHTRYRWDVEQHGLLNAYEHLSGASPLLMTQGM